MIEVNKLEMGKPDSSVCTNFSFLIEYVFGYKDVNKPALDDDGNAVTSPHVYVDFSCKYTYIPGPNACLTLIIDDVLCVGSSDWVDVSSGVDYPGRWHVDLSEEEWKELFVDYIGNTFPAHLKAFMEECPTKLLRIGTIRGFDEVFPNLIKVSADLSKKVSAELGK